MELCVNKAFLCYHWRASIFFATPQTNGELMRYLLIAGLIFAASHSQVASAASVLFSLRTYGLPEGTFTLTARSTMRDNAGIAAYSVELAGEILTLDHSSLRVGLGVTTEGEEDSVGFFFQRSANVLTAPESGTVRVTGSQGSTSLIMYGLGQTAGSLASRGIIETYGVVRGNPWAAEIVIATGTYRVGGNVDFLVDSSLTSASVFPQHGSRSPVPADLVLYKVPRFQYGPPPAPFPEPATGALCGIAAIGFEAIRRRRAISRTSC